MPRCKNCPPSPTRGCYYTGKENTPRGKGYSAKYEKEGKKMRGRDGEMYVVKNERWAKVGSKKGNPKGELLDNYRPTLPSINEDGPYVKPSFHEHVMNPAPGRISLMDKYILMVEKGVDDSVILEVVRKDAKKYSGEDDVEDMIAPVIEDLDL